MRAVETVSSAVSGAVGLSGWRERRYVLASTGVLECAGGRQGTDGMVDGAAGVGGGRRVGDVDHTFCALVCEAISQIARFAAKLMPGNNENDEAMPKVNL